MYSFAVGRLLPSIYNRFRSSKNASSLSETGFFPTRPTPPPRRTHADRYNYRISELDHIERFTLNLLTYLKLIAVDCLQPDPLHMSGSSTNSPSSQKTKKRHPNLFVALSISLRKQVIQLKLYCVDSQTHSHTYTQPHGGGRGSVVTG